MVGSTPNPDAAFMVQAARCLTDAVEGFLAGHRVLICDRDGKWTEGFRGIVEGSGVRVVLTPLQAPNANAYAERFVRSICEECLDRLILFGERRLMRVLDEFVTHYHGERNHQGLGNDLIGVGLGLLIAPSLTAAEAGEPTETLRTEMDRVFRGDPALRGADNVQARRTTVFSVAAQVFDFGETARLSLGRHWEARSEADDTSRAATGPALTSTCASRLATSSQPSAPLSSRQLAGGPGASIGRTA